MKQIWFASLVAAGLLLPPAMHAQTVAYTDPIYGGNQAWSGNLGMDFDVTRPIVISGLGVFDANGDGFATSKTVGIFNRDTQALVDSLFCTIASGTGAPLVNGDRFCPVTPVILPPGHYSVVAVGFGQADLNGNALVGGFQPSTENTGGGALVFVGSGRYDANTSLDFPTILSVDPTNVFNAGTFQFEVLTARTADIGYQVKAFSNTNAGESFIDVINDGANGAPLNGPGFGSAVGNICVNVYAFDPNEEMISCCSCLLTANQVRVLGVNHDILSNTATGVIPTSVVVKLVPTLAGPRGSGTTCTNSAASVIGENIVRGMVAFGTTLHAQGSPVTYATTETPFVPATLSAGELASLTNRCTAIIGNLSGFGICASCRLGALGAGRM